MPTLSDRSMKNLEHVHPDLVKVVLKAAEDAAFEVLEGWRALPRQRLLVAHGASQTLKSRHLTGHAVDLGALVAGVVEWHWPLYDELAAAMKTAAALAAVPLEWGGDWRKFKDGGHFQLPYGDKYPNDATWQEGR